MGLAESVSDAVRKIKAGAVEINGVTITSALVGKKGRLAAEIGVQEPAGGNSASELIVQVGKNWRKIVR